MNKPFVAEIPGAEELRSAQNLEHSESWDDGVLQTHINNIADLLYNSDRGFAKGKHVVYPIISETELAWQQCLLAITLSNVLRARGYDVGCCPPSSYRSTFALVISW